MVVRESALVRRRQDVARIVAAHFIARTRMLASPADVIRKLGARLGLNEDEFKVVLTLIDQPDMAANGRLLGAGERSLVPVLERMGTVMRSLGLIAQVPDLSAILTPDLIPSG